MDSTAQIGSSSGAKHSRYLIQIIAATAALAGLLFGFDTGVISGAILFIKGEFGLTPFAEELLVSSALVGAVCGGVAAYFLLIAFCLSESLPDGLTDDPTVKGKGRDGECMDYALALYF